MTSSNQLKSGFRTGLAFPITLVAVGLLLASLVLGLGTNLARALGEGDGGICGYSDLMREAILANNDEKSFQCNGETYIGADPSWGGADAADGTPNDLDLSGKGISTFEPGKGELDGYMLGSRVDLTGNGLTVADLDIGDARVSFENTPSANFGTSVTGSAMGGTANAEAVGLTFLLDGGSTTSNGIALEAYEGTEGEIVWITFENGDPPDTFVYPGDRDKSVWMRVDVTVEHDLAYDPPRSSSVVSILVNSSDPAGTLYAVPFMIPDDSEIEKTKSDDISIAATGAGTFANAVAGIQGTATTLLVPVADPPLTFDFNVDQFNSDLPRNADEADLTVIDEDTPAVSVQDRQDAIADRITEILGTSAKRVGVDQLAGTHAAVGVATGNMLTELLVGKAFDDDEDAVTSISTGDLAGLTGLTLLDLSDNEIAELPSGLFAEVGTTDSSDLSTRIVLTSEDMGPTGDGFTLENLGPVGDELVAGQFLVVERPYKDARVGFLQDSYEATEGGALVFDVNIVDDDVSANAAIQFLKISGDSGTLPGDDDNDKDVEQDFVDLRKLTAGNYRIAIGLPENDDESGDNTLTAAFGYLDDDTDPNVANPPRTLTTILDVVPITIRDASYSAPVVVVPAETGFGSIIVIQSQYDVDDSDEATRNPDLMHNISNLLVAVGDTSAPAPFLDVYNSTGGRARWGLATSEVVIIEDGTLTQFFQRGVLDFHDTGSGYIVERRLAWDYVGGGEGGSVDQMVEPAPDSGPEGGVQVGAFGHFVANVDADGNATGFLDAFIAFGEVDGLGIPKTEARADTGVDGDGTLNEPMGQGGFTRQYFQAAVFQLSEAGTVELTLLGDTLRNLLIPGHADEAAFRAADPVTDGAELSPDVIS